MKTEIKGAPSFAYLVVTLDPGETIYAEPDAMSSMSAKLDMKAKLNGGLFSALLRKFLGGESLIINEFTNHTDEPQEIRIVQTTPGDMKEIDLADDGVCLEPGTYICSTPDVKLGVRWAGIASFIGREGLFKLKAFGSGKVWIGSYGGIVEKDVDGEYIIDTSHLVAYPPQMKLKVQLSGGIFSSFFGGEGLVTRLEGKGKVLIQTRSLSGLAAWLAPKLKRF
ncbi:MAG: TIGR00266 family protein [Verrucomicrobiota bacterium]